MALNQWASSSFFQPTQVTEEHANESVNLRRWPPQFFRTSNSGKVVGRVTLPSAELDIEVNEGLSISMLLRDLANLQHS